MKISMELIARELKSGENNLSIHLLEDERMSDMNLSGVYSLSIPTNFKSDRLYLIDPHSHLLNDPKVIQDMEYSGAAICCLGYEGNLMNYNIPYICCYKSKTTPDINESTSYDFYKEIYSLLYDIFQKFEDWQQNLFDALQECDLQKMLDISFSIFSVTLSVYDTEFNCLASSGPEYFFMTGNQLPIELISVLKNDSLGIKIHKLKNAYLTPDPSGYFNKEGIGYNIFIMDDYFGRIVAMDAVGTHSFLKSDYLLMNILGRNMQLLIHQNYTNTAYLQMKYSLVSGMVPILERLLNNEKMERVELNRALTSSGWALDEKYYVAYLYLNQNEVPVKNGIYYCRYITQHFTGVYALDQNSFIVLLIRSSIYPKLENFMSQFILFIREGNFRIGLSNLCRDLMQLYYYYRQAEIAFTYGMQKDNTIWCHKFSDNTFEYLIQEAMSEMPGELLCAEELLLLKDYDERKKTDYYRTLKIYLENQMNAVQSAKKLYIHHATMVYRLSRLKELVDIDFTDTDHMLYLHFSYKMLEINYPR